MTDHIAACAAEIVALINASPRTPRVDEVAAIIARAAAPAPLVARAHEIAAHTSKPAAFRPEWNVLVQQLENLSESGDARERRVAELCKAIDAVALKAGGPPARDLDDLRFLAEMAHHYQLFATGRFPALPADMATRSIDEFAVASLLRAVADVTG
jgi:hypothetical protein